LGSGWYDSDSYLTYSVVVRDFTSAGGTLILNQDLLNRPEIFMAIPSPFGDDEQQGLWGVNVVNPTPFPMEVSKVTVTIIPSRPQMQDTIFDTAGNCNLTTVAPTPDFWTCPAINQLMWKNFVTPIVIPAYTVYPFLVTAEPGTMGGSGGILETIITQTNVFTTLGQFGKSGYGTSFADSPARSALASVFLSSVKDSVAPANIRIHQLGIVSETPTTFFATIADFETGGDYQIDDLSRIIINVPRDWINITYPADPDFNISTTTFLGQTQIIGELTVDVTSGGKSLEFTATPPCVIQPVMYVMYILADGTISDGTTVQMAVGPLAEVILQVVPGAPCS